MNINTLMTGTAAEIRQEFAEEVRMIYRNVGDREHFAADIADGIRKACTEMLNTICRASARNFRITENNGGFQTLAVWPKGVNSWSLAGADNVEYVHVFQRRGDAWEALAGILGRGDDQTVMDAEGNEADEYREAGTLGRLIEEMDDPENDEVITDCGMNDDSRTFHLLFGGDEYDWRGL